MSTKKKIIIISILLSIFLVIMIIIAVTRKPTEEETNPEFNPNYAINETKDPIDEEEYEEVKEEQNIYINGREITNLERLTPEQNAAKSQLYSKLHNRVALDETEDRKVVKEEISEASTKFDVFVNVTFSDGSTQIYVIGYDATSMHEYLRCITLEEYNLYNSDENCG